MAVARLSGWAASPEHRRETLEQALPSPPSPAVRVWGLPAGPGPALPVAVGEAAARAGIALAPALLLWLKGMAANLVSAGMRPIPLGQTDGRRMVADLLPLCRAVAAKAVRADPEDLGGCAILTGIAAMRHALLGTRLFRSQAGHGTVSGRLRARRAWPRRMDRCE